MHLAIKQILSNLAAKMEFIKISPSQEKPQCVAWFTETRSDIQAQQNLQIWERAMHEFYDSIVT